jgi:DNA polymerase-3 subunit epsilon
LHGALLDAELLADVYINLTRGQNSLMMDVVGDTQNDDHAPLIDLSMFDLPLLAANNQEIADHEKLLADLDKSSKGKTVWRVVVVDMLAA